MKANNPTLWRWIAILLIVFNLSILGTWLYNRPVQRCCGVAIEAAQPPVTEHLIRQRLGFDGEQMKRFHRHQQSFQRQANHTIATINRCKDSLYREMQRQQPDTLLLNRLSDEIGAGHAALKKSTYHYFLSLKSCCTPPQCLELERLFRPLFCECPQRSAKHCNP